MHAGQARLLATNIFQLDVLRGLAVLLVVCFHYISNYFPFGWVGVDLFFVLSGFLITGKLVESLDSPSYFSSFYIKRILRVAPLYYAVLVVYFIVIPVFAPDYISASLRSLLNQQWYYWTFTENFVEAKNGWPPNASLNHFWSLACEMQFYLFWPVIIKWIATDRRKRIFLILGLILFAIVFRIYITELLSLNKLGNYVLPFSRIDTFAIGGFLYFYLTGSRQPNVLFLGLMAISSLIVILILCLSYKLNWHYSQRPVQMFGYTLNAFFWGAVLGFFCLLRFTKSVLLRCIALAGKYSYGIYVFHFPVLMLAREWFHEKIESNQPFWIHVFAFWISILLAILSYHFYERYFFRLKPVPGSIKFK